MATQDDYIRTALRVPPDLHAQLHASAKDSERTFNAEIIDRLRRTYSQSQSDSDFLESAIAHRFIDAMEENLRKRLEFNSVTRVVDNQNANPVNSEKTENKKSP